jgi:hypothetical protein
VPGQRIRAKGQVRISVSGHGQFALAPGICATTGQLDAARWLVAGAYLAPSRDDSVNYR